LAPSLLTGVLLTENPQLEPATVSSQGAIGLMLGLSAYRRVAR